MSRSRRGEVALEAARLLYAREHKEYFHAKREAARRLGTRELPTNREIHEELIRLSESLGGQDRVARLETMRRVALEHMRRLEAHEPRLVGSVLTGSIRQGSDIDIHLYTDDPLGVFDALDQADLVFEVETARARKRGEEVEFLHVLVLDPRGHTLELTVLPPARLHDRPRSGAAGSRQGRADCQEVARLPGVSP